MNNSTTPNSETPTSVEEGLASSSPPSTPGRSPRIITPRRDLHHQGSSSSYTPLKTPTSSANSLVVDHQDEKSKQKRSETILKIFNRELERNATFVKLTFKLIDCDDLIYMYENSVILNPGLNVNNNPMFKCHIMYLDLTGNRLGNATCCSLLAEILTQNSTIQYLNLSLNDMGVEGLTELVKVFYNIKNKSETSSLLLPRQPSSSSELNDQSQQHVNTTLKHLDLTGNRIGEEGIRTLIDVVKNNDSLVTLSVRSNRVKSSSGVDALMELMALAMSGSHSVREVFV
ncbi:hypothetical protein FDP41_009984 [Naegleria fowleri]|uniref:Uncharacterized protein n=1 Tax=Naegleria fowleri TaxID=5763 RepID=A0A6A5BA00_NAEFO|nr:uncharacterized protein FDP41_009984 [Naegleria fowleri]KAF0971761.1 hypothetical protein FDP41_009984 [Naegleria fowleri]CAG4710014.1 unnamed protein product [Naegleria fowleri]